MAWVRRILPFLSVAILIGLVYDGWVFYSRWSDTRQAEQARVEKEAQDARRTLDRMGGSELKIGSLSVDPAVVARGQRANLCYSVLNAKSVRMAPSAGDVYPALSHCLQVSPRKTTEYKLTATDDSGHTVTQSVRVEVRP